MTSYAETASEKGVPVTWDTFVVLGKDLACFPGEEDWFAPIHACGITLTEGAPINTKVPAFPAGTFVVLN